MLTHNCSQSFYIKHSQTNIETAENMFGMVCSYQVEKRNIFSERGGHPLNSDEEEDGYDSPHARRRGASVDEFLRGSELGRQVSIYLYISRKNSSY